MRNGTRMLRADPKCILAPAERNTHRFDNSTPRRPQQIPHLLRAFRNDALIIWLPDTNRSKHTLLVLVCNADKASFIKPVLRQLTSKIVFLTTYHENQSSDQCLRTINILLILLYLLYIHMNDLITDCQRRLDASVELLQKEYAGLIDLLDVMKGLAGARVSAYGNEMYLSECASARKSKTEIRFSVYDKRMVSAVERAIAGSGLGLSPYTEDTTVVVPIPLVTKERLADVVRVAGKYAALARNSVSITRHDVMFAIAKKQGIGEEERRETEDKIDKMINECLARIDKMLKDREDIFLMRM